MRNTGDLWECRRDFRSFADSPYDRSEQKMVAVHNGQSSDQPGPVSLRAGGQEKGEKDKPGCSTDDKMVTENQEKDAVI